MKKIVFILLLFCSFQSFGQNRFPSIDSLQNYITRYIRNSTLEAFSNYRMNNTVYGITEFLDSTFSHSGVDSIWIVDGGSNADTLRYRRWGVTYAAGLITGGGGSSYIFSNGLTESAGAVKVGGALTQNTTITGGGLYQFNINNVAAATIYAGSGTEEGRFSLTTTNPTLSYTHYTDGRSSSIAVTSNGVSGSASRTGATSQVVVNPDSISLKPHEGNIHIDTLKETATDTTANKPIVWNTGTKRMQRMGWPASGGVPYTLINGATNLGSGAQVFKDTSSNKINLRSLTAGWGLDVTQNTNDIEYKADTAQLATSTAVRDTAQALRYIISGESVAWGTYAQRVALTGMVAGQRFYQTNERVGNWVYDGSQWIHSPPTSLMIQSSQWFPGALTVSASGSGAGGGYGTQGAGFKMSGGFTYVATGTTTTGSAVSYATRTTVPQSSMPGDSASNGFKVVLVGKVALFNAPSASEDFRLNFGTRNAFSSLYNDSSGYGYVFSIANYRNSSFIECYTSGRSPELITTTTSVPITDAVFPQVSGYPNDISTASEGFITFVLVYNTKHCDYYINGTLVASHTLTGSRANQQGANDWIFSIVKRSGTTSRLAAIESLYSYYIKDNY